MKYIFYILLFTLLFSHCITEVPPEPERKTYYLDQEMYDYVIFPKGSWWVYEEENGGMRDSVAIMSKNTELIEHSRFVDYDYERVVINFSSSIRDNFWGETTSLRKGLEDYCLYYEGTNSIGPVSPDDKFASSLIVGDTLKPTQGVIITKHDSLVEMTVNSYSFTHVQVFYRLSDTGPIYKYYYAKGIGLIKEEDVENNKTWNLIDYHINN